MAKPASKTAGLSAALLFAIVMAASLQAVAQVSDDPHTQSGGTIAAIAIGIRSLEALIGRFVFTQRASKTMDDISEALTGVSTQLSSLADLTRNMDKSLEIFIKVQQHRG